MVVAASKRIEIIEYKDYFDIHHMPVDYSGIWLHCKQSQINMTQGWKLHLSSVPIEAAALLDKVLSYLKKAQVSFKIAKDDSTLRLLNEGTLGGTQIGKFMTIYPLTDEKSRSIAQDLVSMTKGFHGPVIASDWRLGDIVYTRYGAYNPRIVVNRLGMTENQIKDHEGNWCVDDYVVPFSIPDGAHHPFQGMLRPVSLIPTKTSGLFGPGFLLLETLKSNPKGSVFLAMDINDTQNPSLCVIKEGRQFCLSDHYGRDMRTRLKHQQNVYKDIKGSVSTPIAGDYFEIAGHGYLVVEHITGRELGSLYNKPFVHLSLEQKISVLDEILNFIEQVDKLHKAGYIHRDLTLSNIRILDDGSVCLLDLELAYKIGDTAPPYEKGTPGFMSPQQDRQEQPAIKDDIYAIGAVILTVLIGLDPRRILFADEPSRFANIRSLTKIDQDTIRMIASCCADNPQRRPDIPVIKSAIVNYREAIKKKSIDKTDSVFLPTETTNAKILANCARGVLFDALRHGDDNGLWLSPPISDYSGKHTSNINNYELYRSASRGIAGVVYGLSRMARFGFAKSVERLKSDIEKSVDWLLNHEPTSDDQMPGLHFGEAGVAVSIAESVQAGLISKGSWFQEYLKDALQAPVDWPDITHGAAGQGLAALLCADLLNDKTWEKFARPSADYLLREQHDDGSWVLPDGAEGMTGECYTGFAHGVAGIIYFLAAYSQRYPKYEKTEAAWKKAIGWLMNASSSLHNDKEIHWPIKMSSKESWNWWCHGSSGIALTFLKLFEFTKEDKYAQYAEKCLNAHPVDLRYSNLSQCHGLSGLADLYLEAEKVLGDPQWRKRADFIANTLLALSKKSNNNGLSWLVEDDHYPTADLMVGSSGVSHFFLRYLCKEAADELGPPLLLSKVTMF